MTFINYNQDYVAKRPASDLAYQLRDMIAVSYCAFDNDCASIKMDSRGIGKTLEMAEKVACELIELCEKMERQQPESVT